MAKRIIAIVLLILGIVPFILPFAGGIYTMSVETGSTMGDWLIMYSFVYWPSYLLGAVLIAVSLFLLIHKTKNK